MTNDNTENNNPSYFQDTIQIKEFLGCGSNNDNKISLIFTGENQEKFSIHLTLQQALKLKPSLHQQTCLLQKQTPSLSKSDKELLHIHDVQSLDVGMKNKDEKEAILTFDKNKASESSFCLNKILAYDLGQKICAFLEYIEGNHVKKVN